MASWNSGSSFFAKLLREKPLNDDVHVGFYLNLDELDRTRCQMHNVPLMKPHRVISCSVKSTTNRNASYPRCVFLDYAVCIIEELEEMCTHRVQREKIYMSPEIKKGLCSGKAEYCVCSGTISKPGNSQNLVVDERDFSNANIIRTWKQATKRVAHRAL